jgi:hypothetical protein
MVGAHLIILVYFCRSSHLETLCASPIHKPPLKFNIVGCENASLLIPLKISLDECIEHSAAMQTLDYAS